MFYLLPRTVVPRLWVDEEYGVLPIFCYNEYIQLGDQIELHFFEPRYIRLLRIACKTQGHCFIYTCARHPQLNSTAYICSINTIRDRDIRGIFTKIVKINQSWIDKEDRLWWCRFQVVKVNHIYPLVDINFSPNFKCVYKNGQIIPQLKFINHEIPTEYSSSSLIWNPTEELRMYCGLCTPTMKRAIIKAATNESDPEYKSLRQLPRGTIWYLMPEHSKKGVCLGQLVKYLEVAMKELTGSTTLNDLLSMIVDLEVLSLKKLRVENVKAGIKYGDDHIVRCPMSQQANIFCFTASLDFGITVGHFQPNDVIITEDASNRIFKKISRKVNKERLKIIQIGHVCSDSPFKKLPTQITEYITFFLIYQ